MERPLRRVDSIGKSAGLGVGGRQGAQKYWALRPGKLIGLVRPVASSGSQSGRAASSDRPSFGGGQGTTG